MRKMLFSACVALAVFGCGGDDGDLPRCLNCVISPHSRCGNNTYNPSTEFCSGSTIYTKCGGKDYNPSTEFCSDGMVYTTRCGGKDYNPSTEFCSENSVYPIKVKGNNISNYRTVAIGTQTWMAENLDYYVEGGKCYGNDLANCNKYGRLYDWATSMALPSSCNSAACSSYIQYEHQGICPSGWHIPSDAEWDVLITAIGGSSTAGTKLKTTSGWNSSNGVRGNGTDDYGFSALPGGHGRSYGSFSNVGYDGDWWSATEGNANRAYGRNMHYDSSSVSRHNYDKSYLFSVRCVQD